MLKENWLKIKKYLIALVMDIFRQVKTEVRDWELEKMTKLKALNIAIFVIALAMGIYFQWSVMEILIFLIFIGIILRPVSSRTLALPALFFLVLTPVMLIAKQDIWAEQVAIYAYYFLVMAVIMGIREVRKEEK